ncbi:helix-turn-helix domain-containing protein [Crateriforma conspicua]|uniref:B12 binding domain protein n=1 Tax=Crateriforma conspicua TaxID=2527996 RepID=A0A5C5Y280_9PLAN|nr:helix-turn-helix domain-containing protein [Crateriforma conspicua]QDV63716.1 B12 binding domain protein [Crateriforma conspicua]TWT69098.1 B12 binding domain protein [Crateriforma conspicua]
MAARQPQYSPKQIAQAMQVSESSVKRWCDRGLIPTIRTVGGHRRITLDALQHFLASQNRSLSQPEVLGLPVLPPNRRTQIGNASDPLQQEFRDSLAAGDERRCRDLLARRIDAGMTRSEAAENLITDAMHGFGRAWECNQLDVYQERRGCDIAMRLIYDLRSQMPDPPAGAPVAIGGSPEGDPYQLPTAMVELALREVGWRATSLGASVPMDSFVQAAHDYSPQLVWMSVSVVADAANFVAAQVRLAEAIGENVPLLIGGRALSDQLRPRLRYTAHCDGLRHLVELAAMMRLNLGRN